MSHFSAVCAAHCEKFSLELLSMEEIVPKKTAFDSVVCRERMFLKDFYFFGECSVSML